MLGKRPHQIQRTTSMSQLRIPPGARSHPHAKDHMSYKTRKPVDALVEVERPKMSSPCMHLDAPTMHTHMQAPAHFKASNPSLLTSTKHTISESFMDACYSCKKPLGHGLDIFMYRGDAAFCSEECRLRQISYDEQRQTTCSVSASQGTSNVDIVDSSKNATVTHARAGAF